MQQVLSNVSITLLKSSGTEPNYKDDPTMLADAESLRRVLKNDEGYKFLRPIRGTPPFCQSARKDLFAMIQQLGIPTWFGPFSSADMRWLTTFSHEQNKHVPTDLVSKMCIIETKPSYSCKNI